MCKATSGSKSIVKGLKIDMMTNEEIRKHYEEENQYQAEAASLEGVLVLSLCQKAIVPSRDEECLGINGFCEEANIGFWDQTYLSKKRIQDTCRNRCPFHRQH